MSLTKRIFDEVLNSTESLGDASDIEHFLLKLSSYPISVPIDTRTPEDFELEYADNHHCDLE
ncbi:MAG: hypothetical protein HW421_4086 [Ignavibacteria bacterium]|nr:hypothetical protein [Ignavibacteria bacterium]